MGSRRHCPDRRRPAVGALAAGGQQQRAQAGAPRPRAPSLRVAGQHQLAAGRQRGQPGTSACTRLSRPRAPRPACAPSRAHRASALPASAPPTCTRPGRARRARPARCRPAPRERPVSTRRSRCAASQRAHARPSAHVCGPPRPFCGFVHSGFDFRPNTQIFKP
ncbi:hypothetical protein IHE45_14G100700 [Dioscorea alata]|uniref:Uncharacterized protein n=1 Tax=Dioscorea alata TaxID=55571 RepID=A0ACB7UU09_DIOAL|nr:hypothetical protein IHE45_14G100700 [Dioscorea alata]